jgi:hypothetical protein
VNFFPEVVGERWPSRLVATAEEKRLAFDANLRSSFWLWLRPNELGLAATLDDHARIKFLSSSSAGLRVRMDSQANH